jgi:hypothetical protein
MKEQIKLGLLAVIALTLIVNTYYQANTGTVVAPRNPNVEKRSAAAAGTASQSSGNITPEFTTSAAPIERKTITSLEFDSYVHDFGNINQESTNNHVFTFTNTGNEPLIIENAKGSCGCTVPEYPKHPINPGETGEIKIEYKPGKQKGNQTKNITITANTQPEETILRIKADVAEI